MHNTYNSVALFQLALVHGDS